MASWTQEQIEYVSILWAKGWSQGRIAADMGVTRNKIAGIANRNRDLMPARSQGGRPQVENPKRVRHNKPKVFAAANSDFAPIDEEPIIKPKEYDYARLPHAKTMLEIGSCECRWALTDEGPHLFCAETTIPGKSWCKHHAQRVVGAGTVSERNAVREARHIGKVAA